MTRALSAFARGRTVGFCLATGFCLAAAVALPLAPAAWAGTSILQSPATTFSTPGVKQVSVQVCNAKGCSTATKSVTVLDPKPAITGATRSPGIVEAGRLVLLSGAGTGKPPLVSSWKVKAAGGATLLSLPGSTLWWDTAGLPPGSYTLSFQMQNVAGTAVSDLPLTVAVAPEMDFYTVTPCRTFDSRLGLVPMLSGNARAVAVTAGGCGIPAGARAVAANVTVINPSGAGYAAVYPGNYPQPGVSTINFGTGETRSNNGVLALSTDGTGVLTALLAVTGSNGNAHMTIDVTGYFLPAP